MRKVNADGAAQPVNWGVGKICYTRSMLDTRPYWSQWAQKLHNLGVSGLAAALLDGAGSLRILAAQLVHAGTPFIGSKSSGQQWLALAALLENHDESQQFVSFLREEDRV